MTQPATVPVPVLEALMRASESFDVPLRVLLGVAWVESRYNPRCGPSSAGAMGLMQLMPDTAKALGVTLPYNLDQSAQGGARFLAQLHTRFGSWEQALAAYVWGPARVAAKPNAADWPLQVRTYVMRVWEAGQRARIPFPVELVSQQEIRP